MHHMTGYFTCIDLSIFILLFLFTNTSQYIIIICITNETFIVDDSTFVPSNNIKNIVFID